MTVIPLISSANAYIGLSKEVTAGTPVAPTYFPRWMDGTSIEVALTAEDIKEGEGTRRMVSQVVKNRQEVKIKLVCSPRMNELGFLEELIQGSGSDTYTAPTVSTTLSANSSIGATSISVAANTGLTGSSPIPLILGAGTGSEEIAIFQPPVSGAGPYTLNVASSYNGGALKLAHSSGNTVKSVATHTLIDTWDGDYATIEIGLGSLNSGPGTTLRVRTCKVVTAKVSGKAGSILMYEIEFLGIASAVQNSPATITLENHPLFLYTQGTWTLDGSTTSNQALTIESFDIERKNNTEGVQTEKLNYDALLFAGLQVDLGFALPYTNNDLIYKTYFGSTSGTVDAQTIGSGSWNLIFTQPDTFESVQYNIATTHYSKVGLPTMKKDGKAYKQQISAASVTNSGLNTYLMQTTITNSQYGSY